MESVNIVSYKEGLFYKLGVRIISDTLMVGFFDDGIGENRKSYGEIIIFDKNGKMRMKGFSNNDFAIGLSEIDGVISYNTLINSNQKITEGEYRKELYSIRMGLIEEPFSYKLLSMKLPYNWGEILNKEILDFEGGEKILEYYYINRQLNDFKKA